MEQGPGGRLDPIEERGLRHRRPPPPQHLRAKRTLLHWDSRTGWVSGSDLSNLCLWMCWVVVRSWKKFFFLCLLMLSIAKLRFVSAYAGVTGVSWPPSFKLLSVIGWYSVQASNYEKAYGDRDSPYWINVWLMCVMYGKWELLRISRMQKLGKCNISHTLP